MKITTYDKNHYVAAIASTETPLLSTHIKQDVSHFQLMTLGGGVVRVPRVVPTSILPLLTHSCLQDLSAHGYEEDVNWKRGRRRKKRRKRNRRRSMRRRRRIDAKYHHSDQMLIFHFISSITYSKKYRLNK